MSGSIRVKDLNKKYKIGGGEVIMDSEFWAYSAGVTALIIVLVVWSVIWKGIALWKAGRNGHLAWYIVMLIFNTAGILEIIYIFAFSKTAGRAEK